MRVLHLNIRLSEGGAARVGVEIHKRLLKNGVCSRYGYGYGRRGLNSPEHDSIQNAFRITGRYTVLANYAIHRLVGVDCLPPSGNDETHLLQEMDQADIIHLHAIHSHYIPYSWLFAHLVAKNKFIIWTAHDQWMITGRCALTENCEQWKNGCGACATKSNYPPVQFDFSRSELRKKSDWLEKALSKMIVVSPSAHLERNIRSQYPNLNTRIVPNSIDGQLENLLSLKDLKNKYKSIERERTILIVANDLAYEGKTDRTMVNNLTNLPNVRLVTVGKNSPFVGGKVVNHGEVFERENLLDIYRNSDALLFTSIVDNFPLVLCEAQASGLPVLSTPSAAGEEVLGFLGGYCLDESAIHEAVIKGDFFSGYSIIKSREQLSENALAQFGGEAMVQRYMALYEELLNS